MDNILPLLLFDNEQEMILGAVNAVLDLAEPLDDVFPLERNNVTRNMNYVENIVPQYTDLQFREHFRMSRVTFEVRFKSK
ncbi:unnamed protein product [Diabrotica balteata]|uniref:Uncharacterized protein n=1 Tax=Diabrotica balteata TaxID=107213 RepID=A0A9N9XB30_DIABA|nr:unnamed protein product [Diabrotica balteata]